MKFSTVSIFSVLVCSVLSVPDSNSNSGLGNLIAELQKLESELEALRSTRASSSRPSSIPSSLSRSLSITSIPSSSRPSTTLATSSKSSSSRPTPTFPSRTRQCISSTSASVTASPTAVATAEALASCKAAYPEEPVSQVKIPKGTCYYVCERNSTRSERLLEFGRAFPVGTVKLANGTACNDNDGSVCQGGSCLPFC